MKRLFIDPTYPVFEKNKLFDAHDPTLNRDDTLAPFIRLKQELEQTGVELLTYDQISNFSPEDIRGDGYVSLGKVRDFATLKAQGLELEAFYVLEPPLIIKEMYDRLDTISCHFKKVFVHNTDGDGYSIHGVKKENLRKMYWPQPYDQVQEKHWSNVDRQNKVVVINGHHKPMRYFDRELYSARINWAVALNKHIPVDLYGRGWDRKVSKANLWWPYLKNYYGLKKIYKGACGSKLPLLSTYDFALCFENQVMDGYITEKIFDCLYSGAIPVYRGGDDIQNWIPRECYVDLRDFRDAASLAARLRSMTALEKQAYRDAGKKFVSSPEGRRYAHMTEQLELGL